MRFEGLRLWRPRGGEWCDDAAAHLLRRAGMGGTREQVELALDAGPEGALDLLFLEPSDSGPVDALLALGSVDLLRAWWMERLREGSLRERVTLTWHEHFATAIEKVDDVRMMYAQNQLFRRLGLGDFRELLRQVARDPAMIVWLDGDSNRVGHANENFARELLELFTLGTGAYDEQDVQEAARGFTGWGVDRGAFRFLPEHHDAGRKSFLGSEGSWNGDDVIDLVVAQPACARHVARRLLRTLVAPVPRSEEVDALADVLVGESWCIGPTLRVLLSSELFFSETARRNRIAAPVELVVSTARAVAAPVSATWLARAAGRMGQTLFSPPSVEGWKPGRSWIDVGRWVARSNAMVDLVDVASDEGLDPEVLRRLWPEPSVAGASPRLAAARWLTSAEGQLY